MNDRALYIETFFHKVFVIFFKVLNGVNTMEDLKIKSKNSHVRLQCDMSLRHFVF